MQRSTKGDEQTRHWDRDGATPEPFGDGSSIDETIVPGEPPLLPKAIGRYRIERMLGRGGFGAVYLGHDEELRRRVAIKVPHRRLLAHPEGAQDYIAEARAVAELEHAGIVPVYDVGSTAEFPCFIVSRYIDGQDLARRLQQGPMALEEIVVILAQVADSLHYAHLRRVVHRDIKPSNLLLDHEGKPYVADFGSALREADIGRGPRYVGTPAYMSPEQARGEGHRVDGRSDIFSLGTVLYEMLTRRRPFIGDTPRALWACIVGDEARPPRQISDQIPKELERICLKALEKKPSDRFTTARDMAEDLRAWLLVAAESNVPLGTTAGQATLSSLPTPGHHHPLTPSPSTRKPESRTPADRSSADRHLPKIVPKGLRAFDAKDADFFLELLPGPRDRTGLPDSIRFWKTRLEAGDEESTFAVGVIYGPSGCGKTSFLCAGVLPRLRNTVRKIYVDASMPDVEGRLLRGLQRHFPGLGGEGGLVHSMSMLRRGQCLALGEKAVVVIDQFEQWLHARSGNYESDLLRALRHADGEHLQCLLLVRDDFWLGTTRFMHELEIPIEEGKNSRLVDLFDLRHARKVLALFGAACGALSEAEAERSKENEVFLEQAVAGLAGAGDVVSVRLALFAEMVKGKPWTPATLRELGGTEGIGVAFLDETFASPTAPPAHRLYRRAAEKALGALLPEVGTDIRTQVRSRDALMQASGLAGEAARFAELMNMLDGELRLVTPIETETDQDDDPIASSPPANGYQLTHDYLVPSLRTWLTRNQLATRQGRAALRLAELAAWWGQKPEVRRLPTLPEFLQIGCYTRWAQWTEKERRMMRKSLMRFALLGSWMAVVLAVPLALWFGFSMQAAGHKAEDLKVSLLHAQIDHVPAIVAEMPPYRRWLVGPLKLDVKDAAQQGNREKRLRAALALLALEPENDDQLAFLGGQLTAADPDESGVLRESLKPNAAKLADDLWRKALAPANDRELLGAASALATYAPNDARWEKIAAPLAAALSRESPNFVRDWSSQLANVRGKLVGPLTAIATSAEAAPIERHGATNSLVVCAADQPQPLTKVLVEGDDEQFRAIMPLLVKMGLAAPRPFLIAALAAPFPDPVNTPRNDAHARKKALAAIALLRLDDSEPMWPLFKFSSDPSVRSYLVCLMRRLGVPARALLARWDVEKDVSARRAILLALGDYPFNDLPQDRRRELAVQIERIFAGESDSGLHEAAQWVLAQWHLSDPAGAKNRAENEKQLRARAKDDRRRWYVNTQGQAFVILDARAPFRMGTPENEPDREQNEWPYVCKIDRRFAIAACPVTKAQFDQCPIKDSRPVKPWANVAESPKFGMSWYEAAAYCNWLSRKEGIAEDQWCYLPNAAGRYDDGMQIKSNYLKLAGYRLPTEAEWEYACRAGAETRFYFGQGDSLLGSYAWFMGNSGKQTWPVALLRPNDFGVFDMLGNVWNMCDTPFVWPLAIGGGQTLGDPGAAGPVERARNPRRVARGGAFSNSSDHVRSAYRGSTIIDDHQIGFGLRPARTIDF